VFDALTADGNVELLAKIRAFIQEANILNLKAGGIGLADFGSLLRDGLVSGVPT
jgi:hypothetical protein